MRLKIVITLCLFLTYSLFFTFCAQAKLTWWQMDVETRSAPVIIAGEIKDTHTTKWYRGGKIEAEVLVEEVIKNEDETYNPLDPSKVTRVEPKKKIENSGLVPVIIENYHDKGAIHLEKGELVLLFLAPEGTSEKFRGYSYRLFDRNGKHTAQNKTELSELVAQTKYFLSERPKYFDPEIRFADILIEGNSLWTASNQGIVIFDKGTGSVIHRYTPMRELYTVTEKPISGYLSLTSDKTGNIWLGSTTGLAKFNGEHWKVFRPVKGKLKGIPDIAVEEEESYKQQLFINEIFVADSGIVWCRGYKKNFTFEEKSRKWKEVETMPDTVSTLKIAGPFIANNGVAEGKGQPLILKWKGNDYPLPSLPSGVYIGDPYTISTKSTLWVTLWAHIENFSKRKFIALARYNLHRTHIQQAPPL